MELTDDEWTEEEWLRAAARNSAFDFLADPQEDIYTLNDGKPFDLIEGLQADKIIPTQSPQDAT